jgi:hypothetical protein
VIFEEVVWVTYEVESTVEESHMLRGLVVTVPISLAKLAHVRMIEQGLQLTFDLPR